MNLLTPSTYCLALGARISSSMPTSMIGLCQEGKSSPDALGRSEGCKILFWFFAACIGRSVVVPISYRNGLPFVPETASGLEQKIEFVFPASLETYQREHRGLRCFAQSA